MLECTLAFLAINQSINQSLGYSLNLNHLFSRIFVLGMILISLNLIACSSSSSDNGGSTPATDNGDGDGNGDGNGDGDGETPCESPYYELKADLEYFYIVKYLGGGATTPISNNAKHMVIAYRKDSTAPLTSPFAFSEQPYNSTTAVSVDLVFTSGDALASNVLTLDSASTSHSIILILTPINGGATFGVPFRTSTANYYKDSSDHCTDANEYYIFAYSNLNPSSFRACLTKDELPINFPNGEDMRTYLNTQLMAEGFDPEFGTPDPEACK